MECNVAIEKKYWHEIKIHVKEINNEFFDVVDKIEAINECPIYLVEFPYGDLIGDHISQFLPLKTGGYIRLNDPKVPDHILQDLGYGKNNSPIGMVLNKKIELFIDLPEKKAILPFMLQSPGDFFSYNHILDFGQSINYAPNGLLYAISGGRCCFLLPSINCQNKFARLCRALEIKAKCPKTFYDHCQLFAKLLKSPRITNNWTATIIYFSENWVKNINSNPKWYEVKQFFHKLYAKRALFPINAPHYNTAYSILLEKKNFKPNPYIFDTFKHIIQIMSGHTPGLAPLINEDLLPLSCLQQIFHEHYGIENIYPTIIGPNYFQPFLKNPEPIYYSLQIPTTSSFSPKSKKTSVMNELKELYDLCETLLEELRSDKGFCANTIIQYVAQSIAITYHHNSEDIDNIISHTLDLINTDNRFCSKSDKVAAENAKFFRGCIRIFKK